MQKFPKFLKRFHVKKLGYQILAQKTADNRGPRIIDNRGADNQGMTVLHYYTINRECNKRESGSCYMSMPLVLNSSSI